MESLKICNVCYLNYDTKDHAPRSLPCGHTICSACLKSILNQPTLRKCPFDNTTFAAQNPLASFPPNFALMDLLEQRNSNTCRTHIGEKLKFICLTDQTKICAECANHKSHKTHKVKKIKELKAQGAKVKRELQDTLGTIKNYEQEKAEDFEQIRKVFISAIDEQVKEVKNILVEKQLEWIQQVNNIFDADKKHDSEGLEGLKEQMGETIKNITHACQDENGDLMVLEKEANNNDQSVAKKRPQSLKDKSSKVQERILEMQASLKEAFVNSQVAINSIYLSTQDTVKEIYSQSSQEELIEIQKKMRSVKFMSHYDIEIDSGRLNISFKHTQKKELEINLVDFQEIEKVHLEGVRCDILEIEPHPNALSYIFHGLKKFTDLTVSFDSQNFDNEALLWLGNTIQSHASSLKAIELCMLNCKFDDQTMQILCDKIYSKTHNLSYFGLDLNSCQILDSYLEILVKYLRPFERNLECLRLELGDNRITEDGMHKIFEIIKKMKKLQDLQLYYFRSADMSEGSFTMFGEAVLPSLTSLDYLTLFLNDSGISDKGLCPTLRNLPNLKGFRLSLSDTFVTNKTMKILIEEVLPRLESLEFLDFEAHETQISKENLDRIRKFSSKLSEKNSKGHQ